MQLKQIKIDNFKSLLDFEMDFKQFNCIIGLNGAGKSTLLQALDFISQTMKGDISHWLKKRGWEGKDLHSKLTKAKNISFVLYIQKDEKLYIYEASFNTSKLKCSSEVICIKGIDNKLFKVENSKYHIDKQSGVILQEYEGSFLSSIKEDKISTELIELKNFISNITSLDLLSPQSLRQKSRSDGKELGLSGEHLTTFLKSLDKTQQNQLQDNLKKCYPNMDEFEIISSYNGWKRLEVSESYNNRKIITEAKHLNDGFLRLISILAQLFTSKDFLLFDEIENGINPELIEFLVDTLIDSSHQVLIATHSPMILNFIEDEVAEGSVKYIYKTKSGITGVINFFDIPSMSTKLKVMGAGEVYADTNLSMLYDEIISLKEEK